MSTQISPLGHKSYPISSHHTPSPPPAPRRNPQGPSPRQGLQLLSQSCGGGLPPSLPSGLSRLIQSTVTAGLLMTLLFPFNSGLPARLTAAFLRKDGAAKRQRSKEKKQREKDRRKGTGSVRESGSELRSGLKSPHAALYICDSEPAAPTKHCLSLFSCETGLQRVSDVSGSELTVGSTVSTERCCYCSCSRVTGWVFKVLARCPQSTQDTGDLRAPPVACQGVRSAPLPHLAAPLPP